MPESAVGPWLAIDYGERLVGVALAHPLTATARPLKPIHNASRAHLEAALLKLFEDWQPSRIIIGLPLDGAGADTPMSRKVRRFAGWLRERFASLEVELQDERMSSEQAASQFAARRASGRARRKDAASLDSQAAAVILDAWMRDHGCV